MADNRIKKSLHKFLSDNLDIFVTYDSNESNIANIEDLNPSVDIFYSGIPITKIVLNSAGYGFSTTEDLVGKTLRVEIDGVYYSDTIKAWTDLTSEVELDNGFSVDILSSNKISILSDRLLYLCSPFEHQNAKSRLISIEEIIRYDIYVKVKEDSDKDKISDILQNIKNLIFSNRGIFKIYNDDLITEIGYATINLRSYECKEIVSTGSDLQSYLVTFTVSYYNKYI